MMRSVFIWILVFCALSSNGQDKGFFSDVEYNIEFNLIGAAFSSSSPIGSKQLNLEYIRDYKNDPMELIGYDFTSKPYDDNEIPGYLYSRGPIISYYEIKSSLIKPLSKVQNKHQLWYGLSFGLRSYGRTQPGWTSSYLTNSGIEDTLWIRPNDAQSSVKTDTMLLVPRYSSVEYNKSTTISCIGASLKIDVIGSSMSRFRAQVGVDLIGKVSIQNIASISWQPINFQGMDLVSDLDAESLFFLRGYHWNDESYEVISHKYSSATSEGDRSFRITPYYGFDYAISVSADVRLARSGLRFGTQFQYLNGSLNRIDINPLTFTQIFAGVHLSYNNASRKAQKEK